MVFRQGRVEGGFQGRTNKLVDGCYSLWQVFLTPKMTWLDGHCLESNEWMWSSCLLLVGELNLSSELDWSPDYVSYHFSEEIRKVPGVQVVG